MKIEGEFNTHSAAETFDLGSRVAEQLSGRAVLLLKGDLGAGKTVFAKGIAAGLGIDSSEVTSPSFTLINVHDGRLRLYHVDLYRLESATRLDLGLDEILEDENGVVVVEWAERLGFVPEGAVEVELSYVSDSERRIVIQ
ncbi:MAG TPA: tRNA (adenosine(37)-N6)-threonylcarbamoyltransferase complex ATPase subunit type 1 TsaE [Blastocatellia bacterium]|nr:tRNA (adenosine(37)-N6)-threonylcarbamoyltransferase complex ATPase subunit type 1 TsaE [Blastocatellia bacterium]